MRAANTTMKPPIRMTNTAGPSPASAKEKSSPQRSQRDRRSRKPANNLPSPQRGQRPRRPREIGRGFSLIAPILKQKGGAAAALFDSRPPSLGMRQTRAPDIDAGEQEQPDHVDEVPVPGGELEAQMLLRREVAGIGAPQAHAQEDSADQHMEAVKAGRHEEGRAIDVAREVEQRMAVFI